MITRRRLLGAMPAIYCLAKAQAFGSNIQKREYHVAVDGNDANDGTVAHPLRTISAASHSAQPGDTITVHKGVYRERVNPPRGGTSDSNRITYQAAPGDEVILSGAELVSNWTRVEGDVWKTIIPNSLFGSFNPYKDLIHGDWFEAKGREHHTGAVYLNGDWFIEAAAKQDVFKPATISPLWFAEVDSTSTTLWAQFPKCNPNQQQTEINVRQTVFYPEKPGINYITVRGFTLRQAATPWAPPTAQQIGVVGPHWAKGWIIENNIVSHSTCCGISLGKYGDEWDNTSANSAEGYVATIDHALKNGWSKDKIGSHIVRCNTVSHCEQAGIVGSLGAIFSCITENTVHSIHIRQLFSGAEMAGIKIHAAIDTEISHNHIYNTCKGLWLDWMAQGTHVYGNLFQNNTSGDFMPEVNHGPYLVDNNLFLSNTSQIIFSQGGAYAHNLFCGRISLKLFEARVTPYMTPHSTQIGGYHNNPSGDMRFLNNIFARGGDLSPFDKAMLPMTLDGNVFLKGTKPCIYEKNPLLSTEEDTGIRIADSQTLEVDFKEDWTTRQQRKLVTSELLGITAISKLPFETANGKQISIDRDYSGNVRNSVNPLPGPFEFRKLGRQRRKIWGDFYHSTEPINSRPPFQGEPI